MHYKFIISRDYLQGLGKYGDMGLEGSASVTTGTYNPSGTAGENGAGGGSASASAGKQKKVKGKAGLVNHLFESQ